MAFQTGSSIICVLILHRDSSGEHRGFWYIQYVKYVLKGFWQQPSTGKCNMAVLIGNSIISGFQAYCIMVWRPYKFFMGTKFRLFVSILDLPAKHNYDHLNFMPREKTLYKYKYCEPLCGKWRQMAGAYASQIQRTAVSCHVHNVMQHHLPSLPPNHHSPPTMMIIGFHGELGGKIGGNASLSKGDRRPT